MTIIVLTRMVLLVIAKKTIFGIQCDNEIAIQIRCCLQMIPGVILTKIGCSQYRKRYTERDIQLLQLDAVTLGYGMYI
jgi:hypothetical protein